MKASAGFAFFLLFLGGFALVNLRSMSEDGQATPPTVTQLTERAWRPSHIGEMRLDETTQIFVQFDRGGSLGGHGGCNRIFGSYALDGDSLKIEGLGMSRMACGEAVMSIEFAFVEALQAAATIDMRAGRMAIRDAEGVATARFDAVARKQ